MPSASSYVGHMAKSRQPFPSGVGVQTTYSIWHFVIVYPFQEGVRHEDDTIIGWDVNRPTPNIEEISHYGVIPPMNHEKGSIPDTIIRISKRGSPLDPGGRYFHRTENSVPVALTEKVPNSVVMLKYLPLSSPPPAIIMRIA
jgi:hypothetical protein